MRLLIDTDEGGLSPNWEGFEYIINRSSPVSGKTSVEKSLGGFSWEKVGDAEIEIAGKLLQIKVDRKLLGFEPDGSVPHMNFKWADDNIRYGDIMELYTDGEAAPGGRFTFKF